MEVWVAGPAAAVSKRRRDEPITRNLVDAIGAAPRPTRGAFQIAESGVDGGVVRVTDLRGDFELAEAEQDGHRLRCPEREIESRDVIRPDPAQRDTGIRVTAFEHRVQGVAVNDT